MTKQEFIADFIARRFVGRARLTTSAEAKQAAADAAWELANNPREIMRARIVAAGGKEWCGEKAGLRVYLHGCYWDYATDKWDIPADRDDLRAKIRADGFEV